MELSFDVCVIANRNILLKGVVGIKKYGVLLVLLACILGLAACGQQQVTEEENRQDYFNATILEVHDPYILVVCLDETSGAVTPGTQAEVCTDLITETAVPNLNVGDNIRVVFNATEDTIPIRVLNVFAIYLLDENGEPIDL